ncbi:MAG: hypothetical protein JNL98_02655 [Bryobacterales bacterium]|nr:hypothetical protein [Bryobacterales bacterium]
MTTKHLTTCIVAAALLCCINLLAQNPEYLAISAPRDGDQFYPAQTVRITVSSTAGAFKSILVRGEDGSISSPRTSPPYEFDLTLDSRRLGLYQITAIGVRSDDRTVQSRPLQVDIESPLVCSRLISINSHIDFLYVGDTLGLRVRGLFSDGRIADIGKSTRLSVISDDPNIVRTNSFDSATAFSSGSTTIRLRYQNPDNSILQMNVSATVPELVRGDLTGDGQINSDDIGVIQLFLNHQAACPNDARDLNRDGKIDALDVRIMTTLCTKARCSQ